MTTPDIVTSMGTPESGNLHPKTLPSSHWCWHSPNTSAGRDYQRAQGMDAVSFSGEEECPCKINTTE
ncbi:hypothetical protein JTB14_015896 [Gonioctena quinquepunctata]|nr:hypothetical protein JTB14_015896 [Gonioctena quinquepunctata]